MLIGAMIVGALMGLIIEAGQRGLIPAWGGDTVAGWVKLMLYLQGCAAIYSWTDTDRGALIVSLCWLGAMTLGRAVTGAAIELGRAVRNA